ncbi:ATP-dependent Clp protease ATP-binding subunit, partial [Clostridiaceae bacterium OttesenSCG-928-D20]|nr:ATP-dependent Clp protease ATP-binding subunit [Clostridiaceae bacterium OttesenSCG-928-D20]
MQTSICSRCNKNIAVVFITKLENGTPKNEGLCLKCARELNIKPIDDAISKMGLSDEELDGLSDEMSSMLSGAENLGDLISEFTGEDADDDDDGKTTTFPI